MARILIVIGGHLCTAPRPQKEAAALCSAGHDVTVAGGWHDAEFARWDEALAAKAPYRFVRFADLRAGHPMRTLRRAWAGLRRRFAQRHFARTGRASPALLGQFACETRRYVRRHPADLVIAHAESAMIAVDDARRSGRRVGVDFEDWFSEDLLPADRIHRPVDLLRQLEVETLRNATYALTTSGAMAASLAAAAGTAMPGVVYNTFPDAPLDGRRCDRPSRSAPSLHWFSQTIGPGRGLERLFEALPLLSLPCEIHVRGRLPDVHSAWFESRVPGGWRDRITLHPLAPNAELPSRIAEHDIGLALEESVCPSRDLTITNKFFQYLQAGLAVIATDTQGQTEAARRAPEAVVLVPQRSAERLASALTELLRSPEQLRRAKAAARRAYVSEFSWDRQASIIEERCARALAAQPLCPPP